MSDEEISSRTPTLETIVELPGTPGRRIEDAELQGHSPLQQESFPGRASAVSGATPALDPEKIQSSQSAATTCDPIAAINSRKISEESESIHLLGTPNANGIATVATMPSSLSAAKDSRSDVGAPKSEEGDSPKATLSSGQDKEDDTTDVVTQSTTAIQPRLFTLLGSKNVMNIIQCMEEGKRTRLGKLDICPSITLRDLRQEIIKNFPALKKKRFYFFSHQLSDIDPYTEWQQLVSSVYCDELIFIREVVNESVLTKKHFCICGNAAIIQCTDCCSQGYCSMDCQNKHWVENHSKECGERQRRADVLHNHQSTRLSLMKWPLTPSSEMGSQSPSKTLEVQSGNSTKSISPDTILLPHQSDEGHIASAVNSPKKSERRESPEAALSSGQDKEDGTTAVVTQLTTEVREKETAIVIAGNNVESLQRAKYVPDVDKDAGGRQSDQVNTEGNSQSASTENISELEKRPLNSISLSFKNDIMSKAKENLDNFKLFYRLAINMYRQQKTLDYCPLCLEKKEEQKIKGKVHPDSHIFSDCLLREYMAIHCKNGEEGKIVDEVSQKDKKHTHLTWKLFCQNCENSASVDEQVLCQYYLRIAGAENNTVYMSQKDALRIRHILATIMFRGMMLGVEVLSPYDDAFWNVFCTLREFCNITDISKYKDHPLMSEFHVYVLANQSCDEKNSRLRYHVDYQLRNPMLTQAVMINNDNVFLYFKFDLFHCVLPIKGTLKTIDPSKPFEDFPQFLWKYILAQSGRPLICGTIVLEDPLSREPLQVPPSVNIILTDSDDTRSKHIESEDDLRLSAREQSPIAAEVARRHSDSEYEKKYKTCADELKRIKSSNYIIPKELKQSIFDLKKRISKLEKAFVNFKNERLKDINDLDELKKKLHKANYKIGIYDSIQSADDQIKDPPKIEILKEEISSIADGISKLEKESVELLRAKLDELHTNSTE